MSAATSPFLLDALHRLQAAEGRLTRDGLIRLAEAFHRPPAEVVSAADFYHYFAMEPAAPAAGGRCRGPVCSLHRSGSDPDPALPAIPCPGLCDRPVAAYAEGRFLADGRADGGFQLPHPVATEEALFRHARTPKAHTLAVAREAGAYAQLRRVLRESRSDAVLDQLERSGLAGRGGAGFPLAAKWRAVRDSEATPRYVVCNADEGEPGTFKDRALLHLQPHLVLEGMAIAGAAVGSETGIIYLRYEYPEALEVLATALREAEAAGWLGDDIANSGRSFQVSVVRGAGSYICGEETALLNSLEGTTPWPRERPPFPTTHGLWGKPTLVNNVETLSCVPRILEHGPDWFRSLGRNGNPGTKIYSVSGAVRRPGNYELPLGVTARELIEEQAGGAADGGEVKAFTLGGISGGLLGAGDLDLPLDFTATRARGVFLGSGGVIVLDATCCVVDFVRTCLAFYESESCGRCFPCRIGTARLREWLDGLTGRAAPAAADTDRVAEIGAVMTATSACGLGTSAPLVVEGMLERFPEEVQAHREGTGCPAGVCR